MFNATSLYTWGDGEVIEPNPEMVIKLKRYKYMGGFIIVISCQGVKWANTVVQTLGLTDFVDLVMKDPRRIEC